MNVETSEIQRTNGAPAGAYPQAGLFDIDLRRILNLVRRNLLWIALIIGLALAAGLAITMLTVPRYIAAADVLVEDEADQIIEGADLTPQVGGWDTERFLQTQMDIIESRTMAERVASAGKLAEDDGFFKAMGVTLPEAEDLDPRYSGPEGYKKYREQLAVGLLDGGVTATMPGDTRVISIQFESVDPGYSAKMANAFAENYIQSNLNRKFDSSAYARQFLADQLDEAKARLEKSERDLNQYSRAAGLIRVSGQGQDANQETTLSVTNDSLVQANTAAGAATAERVAAQDRWQTIANEPVLSVPQVLANSAVQALIRQKAELQANLAQERSRHLDGHPSVKALQAQVGELDARLNQVGNSIKRSVFLEYRAAQEKEQSLAGQVGQLRGAALEEQDRGVEYNVLKRVAETNRSLYDTLLQRFNELNATAGAASNNITLVDRAQPPGSPSSPNLVLNMALALLAGLVLAAIFVFLRDFFDDAIRSPEDAEAKIGLPMLGLIPRTEDSSMAIQDRKSAMSEAYHALVANLMYSTERGLPKSLLVTSASEAEGKSTTAHAIALDLSRLGNSVLLIDADLRRPTLHRRMDDPNKSGLTEVLAGQATLDDVLTKSSEPNLYYVTGLPIPPEPSILLGGERLPRLLEEAGKRFDVVILDTPPMLGLSDAATLATRVEGVLVMIDASNFRRGAVKSSLRRLSLVNANVLGAVLTKFDPKSADGEYRYYSYEYYQYGAKSDTA